MKKKEVKEKIVEKIKKQIEFFEFKYDLKNEWFLKETPDSIFIYDLFFYDRTEIKTGIKGALVEPFVWINVKKIENYYKEITLNEKLKKEYDFRTLGESVAELIANPDGIHRKWNESLNLLVFEEKDISTVAKELFKQFEKFALPYFLKNGSVKMVDYLLNRNPTEYCVHMSNDLFRFIKGLLAAKLNKNQDFNDLLITYSRLLVERDMPEYCQEEMSRLKSILPMIGIDLTV